MTSQVEIYFAVLITIPVCGIVTELPNDAHTVWVMGDQVPVSVRDREVRGVRVLPGRERAERLGTSYGRLSRPLPGSPAFTWA